ncbi:hypothetical protein BGZ60DRAFT_501544 [Tricladium varicosporioides]|nr:hypothetical protein BGZ60DRAFT_501544 [Hymenoscyphus varicosporioides]
MAKPTPSALVGCLLDVSGSMRNVLETGRGDKRAIERLHVVLRAALKLACAEQRHNPNALMFVGAFGMKSEQTPVVDLCGLADGLLNVKAGLEDGQSGHERLIALANEQNVAHITKYIRTRLTENEARIVHIHLQRHPDGIKDFVNAIPSAAELDKMESTGIGVTAGGILSGAAAGVLLAPALMPVAIVAGLLIGNKGSDTIKNHKVDNSIAMKLARHICKTYLQDFKDLLPRPVSDVITLLERLQDHPSVAASKQVDGDTLLDELNPHIYGSTFMRVALRKTLAVFRSHPDVKQRALVLVSDGVSTDGDPLPLAKALKQENVTIASIFLTNNDIASRRLYDKPSRNCFNEGQIKLFSMASTVSVLKHPIPVLASIGWRVPSSGECALYTSVCSSNALEEFCSFLLSARFGSADALFDIIGRVQLDGYINDEHVRTCNNPSNQGQTSTCYAHATAAVLHMALLRIYAREGGCPAIAEIRSKILKHFPPKPNGESVDKVLRMAMGWYPPLRFRTVDQDGARQAVLHRRPVLATFWMADSGWTAFSTHFKNTVTRDFILTKAHMASHRLPSDLDNGGGHAVVMTRCDPRSLTFLNSFSIEKPAVLELGNAGEWARMRFFDVYWYEGDLKAGERRAYQEKVDKTVRTQAAQYPSLLELEVQCPHCQGNAPIADFTGSIRRAVCPLCRQTFQAEAEHLVRALYARAGLGNVK